VTTELLFPSPSLRKERERLGHPAKGWATLAPGDYHSNT